MFNFAADNINIMFNDSMLLHCLDKSVFYSIESENIFDKLQQRLIQNLLLKTAYSAIASRESHKRSWTNSTGLPPIIQLHYNVKGELCLYCFQGGRVNQSKTSAESENGGYHG